MCSVRPSTGPFYSQPYSLSNRDAPGRLREPPGMRDGSLGPMYLAYVRDPDGHKLCAIHRIKR